MDRDASSLILEIVRLALVYNFLAEHYTKKEKKITNFVLSMT